MAYTTVNKSSSIFNTKIYTGTGSTRSITGVGFQPDLVWIKKRAGGTATSHTLTDSVRGLNKQIFTDDTAAEESYTSVLTAFNSDGFGLSTAGLINNNTSTYVAWNWKAGTSVSGNTSGSGTYKAYTGSVNTTAGFSIINYLGNGSAGHSIPHHLGVTPEIIITKRRSNTGHWYVYSPVMGNTKHMRLDNNGAEDTANTIWNNTSPTSSVFTVGTNGDVNGNNNPIIAYSFNSVQGYSKFGLYKGNGNANGTFIYTGFKPAFVIMKKLNGADGWLMKDTTRITYNLNNIRLYPDQSGLESTSANSAIDMLSNGFKQRSSDNMVNASSGSYLYMAFAEAPLVGSNNIPCTAR